MADLEQGLVAALRADVTVGPLVSNGDSPETFRIYHEILPQEVSYPAIAYARIASQRILTLGGPSSLTSVTLAVDVWARTTSQLRTLAAAVRAALDGVTGSLGGTSIQSCVYDSDADLSVFDGDRDDRRMSISFVVWLNE